MATQAARRAIHSLEVLERMLNNSSLSTKKVTHVDILDLGDELFKKTYVDVDAIRAEAVKEALAIEEKRHMRELKAALTRREEELEKKKQRALERQKQHYEDLARRVAEQRDRAEEERVRQLKRQYDKEREDALAAQWEECERLKELAIEEACEALRIQLRREFCLERERAVSEALNHQKKKFLIREQESIARTRNECEAAAKAEADRVAALHKAEVTDLTTRLNNLDEKLRREVKLHNQAMRDFRELQTDYKRFMDYTDGRYHSDYMMRLRRHGMRLAAASPVKPVTIEEITSLWET